MRFSSSLLLAGFACGVLTQDFEPADFNTAGALIDFGVNVSSIPVLADLSERSSTAGCSIACSTLKLLYSSQVLSENSAAYNTFTSSYWSTLQAEVDPYCVFQPTSSTQISVLVLLSRLTQCPHAVRSGGHAAFAGGSSIEGGITVSFANMKAVTLASDKQTAVIQPGNVWGDVYTSLSNSDLTVIGGRVYSIGVGGLTTGGGISFFSNIYGWACDNVVSYDIVTASGIPISVSASSYPDLYWALRGGSGGNFGIITAFHYKTIAFPGNNMWGGTRVYLESDFPRVATAFSNLIKNSPTDPKAGQWVAFVNQGGMKIAATEFWYTQPNGQTASIWNEYNNITAVADTTQNRKLYEYAAEVETSNPDGFRQSYYGLTTKADPRVAQKAYQIFFNGIANINVAGALPALIYQGITKGQVAGMQKNGGNPLGLADADAPFYLIHIAFQWTNAADDAVVYQTISNILTKIKLYAQSLGVANDYIYMNYASQFEDVIASYGAANKQKLKSVASKYDPTGFFQEFQPGYFKLNGPPIKSSYFSG